MNNKPATSLGSTVLGIIASFTWSFWGSWWEWRDIWSFASWRFDTCLGTWRCLIPPHLTSIPWNAVRWRLLIRLRWHEKPFFFLSRKPRVSLAVAPFMSRPSSHPHDPRFNQPLPPADKPSNTNPGTPTQTHTQIHTHPVHNLYSISLSSHLLGIPVT